MACAPTEHKESLEGVGQRGMDQFGAARIPWVPPQDQARWAWGHRQLVPHAPGRPQIAALDHQQRCPITDQVPVRLLDQRRQVAQDQSTRDLGDRDARLFGDLGTQPLGDLGNDQHGRDLGQDQRPLRRPEKVEPEFLLDQAEGLLDRPALGTGRRPRAGVDRQIEHAGQVAAGGVPVGDGQHALTTGGLVGATDPEPDQVVADPRLHGRTRTWSSPAGG